MARSQNRKKLARVRSWVLAVAVMAGVFLSALDFMIVNVSLKVISDDLGGLTMAGWATSSYVITSTVAAPIYGRLCAYHGTMRLYLAALCIFALGTILCAVVASVPELAVARAVKGVGAGGLMTLALTYFAETLPESERTRMAAFTGGLFTCATIVGPLIGGTFAESGEILGITGWRWMFLFSAPLAILVGLVVLHSATPPVGKRKGKIDGVGGVLLCAGAASLMLAIDLLIRIDTIGWPSAFGLLACTSFVLLYLHERKYGEDALLPSYLMSDPTFRRLNLVNFLFGSGIFACGSLVPLYLQVVQGFSPTHAGLLLVPQAITATIVSLAIDRRMQVGASDRGLLLFGFGCLGCAALLWSAVSTDTSIWALVGITIIYGIGLGLCMQVLLIEMQRSLSDADVGLANGYYAFGRQLGGACAAVIVVALTFSMANIDIEGRVRSQTANYAGSHEHPTDCVITSPLHNRSVDLNDTRFLDSVSDETSTLVREAILSSMASIFFAVAGVFGLGWLLCALRKRAGIPQ